MTVQRGAALTLDIEKPAAGGRMLARQGGQVVLVSGTIPGERVRAVVERVGKGVLFADTQEVLTASSDRRPGAVDGRCGGNVYAHIDYERQRGLKADIILDAFTRIGRLPLPASPDVIGSPETGYRMRARLHVQGSRIGFFREGSHELCDAAATGQLQPSTIEWLTAASGTLRRNGLTGALSVELAENIPGDQRAVHVELQPGTDRGAYEELMAGPTVISDLLHVEADTPLRLQRDVRAFFQGNRFLLEPLVRRVVALARTTEPLVDLYAGVGLFGLSAAAAGAREVILVEGDSVSGADLVRNAEPLQERVRVHRQSVEAFLASPNCPHGPGGTFVVDPPRTGMTREALAGIINHQPGRIVYVSCDVATLARDSRTLVDAGWELEQLTGIDLFPNTAHVESVALFTRPRQT